MKTKSSVTASLTTLLRQKLKVSGLSRLIVGVSGGADSVALLALLRLSGAEVTAAHCNFHLRGEESLRDEAHVRSLCALLEVPLETVDFDVHGFIESNPGTSVEMACRSLRYEWFFNLLESSGADRIAIAHNADDNAETLFLNLLRGSGTKGLRGMVEDNGKVWRPVLSVHRHELEAFLKENNIPFITDSSNLISDYRRNFLRNEIFPLLRSRWEGFDKAMQSSLSFLRAENEVVEQAIADRLPSPGAPLEAEVVLDFAAPELLVRRFIDPLSPFTTTASEVVDAMRAAKPDVKRWTLRKGFLELRNGKLFLKKDV